MSKKELEATVNVVEYDGFDHVKHSTTTEPYYIVGFYKHTDIQKTDIALSRLHCFNMLAYFIHSVLDRHIMPHFKHYRLDEIKPSDIRAWQTKLLQELTPGSVKNVRHHLTNLKN